MMHGVSCKYRPRPCAAVLLSPAAGDVLLDLTLWPVSSATNQRDSKVNSCPTDNVVPANFALVHVMGIYSSLS